MITPQQLNQLWGSMVDSWDLSMTDFTLVARLNAVTSGVPDKYELRVSGIHELHFEKDKSSRWDYIELTSIAVDENTNAPDVEMSMEFWNGIAKARMRAESVSLKQL